MIKVKLKNNSLIAKK